MSFHTQLAYLGNPTKAGFLLPYRKTFDKFLIIYSLNNYLLHTYYVPGTVLSTVKVVVNKIKFLAL